MVVYIRKRLVHQERMNELRGWFSWLLLWVPTSAFTPMGDRRSSGSQKMHHLSPVCFQGLACVKPGPEMMAC